MPPVGFEFTISAGERPQIYALDRAAAGTGNIVIYSLHNTTYIGLFVCLLVFGAIAPQWVRVSSFMRFLDHTERRTTVGRTPLDE